MYRFYVSHCFLPHSRSYSVCFSFSTIFIFLSILQVLQCAFLIFPVFECFSTIQLKHGLCLIFDVFQFSRHIPGPRVCSSQFARFSVFLQFSRTYIFRVSFSTLFSFLPTFQVIQCLCLILKLLTFSQNNTGPTLCISHFQVSHCFLPHSRSYSVCFSFSTIFIFLSILQVLQCAFLIFPVFECFSTIQLKQCLCLISTFFNFLAIFQVLKCVFLNLHIFPCFLPNSRTYSVRFSYSTFFSSLAIFQVLECVFLIFHVFDCF